ncbi:sel1 repeat family protein, partial [Klebsiella pneumoniae]|nr:sel1 repeat family protein [Klebsiella pneumoniae]
LIEKLAKAKQLNPATGRPLPTSPDFEKDSVARLQCRSGEPCPQSGYWQPAWRPREGMSEHAIRYFREGDIMPVEKVTFVR